MTNFATYYDARLEASDIVERTAMRMWTELVKIWSETPRWKLLSRWRRKWMMRTAWALVCAARDEAKVVEKDWDEQREKTR